MVTETPIEQQAEQPRTTTHALSSESAIESAGQSQRVESATIDTSAAHGAQASSPRTALPLSKTTIVAAGVVLAAVTAIFVIGLTRSRARPTMRRVMRRAHKIEVPLLFPLTVVDFAREVISGAQTQRP